MNLCSLNMPLGLNQACITYLQRADKLLLVEKSTAFTAASLGAKTEFVTAIQQNLTMTVLSLSGYEDTSDDPTKETTQFGEKLTTLEPPPSMQAYVKVNPCDWQNMLSTLRGGEYDIIPLLADGTILTWRSGTSAYGFTGRVNAIVKGVPPVDNISQQFRIDIDFTEFSQFTAYGVTVPTYNPLTELLLVVPNGYRLTEISNNGTTAVVSVYERCGDAVTGLALADFEIVEQNAGTSITGVTDNSDGTYDIAIALTAGQYAVIREKEVTGSDVDTISNNITLTQ